MRNILCGCVAHPRSWAARGLSIAMFVFGSGKISLAASSPTRVNSSEPHLQLPPKSLLRRQTDAHHEALEADESGQSFLEQSHMQHIGAMAEHRHGLQRREFFRRTKFEEAHGVSDVTVWCGGHSASECEACASGHGASWCNGDCEWSRNACSFRADLVWCGGHAAKSCNDCVIEAPPPEMDTFCNGECEVFNGTCHHFADANLMRHLLATEDGPWGSRNVTNITVADYGGLPDPSSVYYTNPDGDPLRYQVFMAFYDFGCCRTADVEEQGSSFGVMAAADCMHKCLNSEICIAVDIGGPDAGPIFSGPGGEHSFECTMYAGKGHGFTTSCTSDLHCYRKVVPGTTHFRSNLSPRRMPSSLNSGTSSLNLIQLREPSDDNVLNDVEAPRPGTSGHSHVTRQLKAHSLHDLLNDMRQE